jgi:hypothetical protein
VIPVLLIVGLLCGRWSVVAVATIAWPLVLLVDGACSFGCAPAAAALAAANAAVGVVTHKAVVWPLRLAIAAWRDRRRPAEPHD